MSQARGRIRGRKGRKRQALCPTDAAVLKVLNQGLRYLEQELRLLAGIELDPKAQGQKPELILENWPKVIDIIKRIHTTTSKLVSTDGLEIDPDELIKRGLEYLEHTSDALTKMGPSASAEVLKLMDAMVVLKTKVGGVQTKAKRGVRKDRWA